MRRALFSRRWPHWSWFAGAACIALTGLIIAPDAVAQTLTLDIGEPGGSTTARLIQLVGVVTLLSIAPGILVTVTSFTRLVIVFSLLRTALGTQQSPPNIVMISLALFLTGFIMAPTLEKSWQDGISPLIEERIDEFEAFERASRSGSSCLARCGTRICSCLRISARSARPKSVPTRP